MHGVEGVDPSNIRGVIESFVRIPKVGDSEVAIGAVIDRVITEKAVLNAAHMLGLACTLRCSLRKEFKSGG